jgi:membrane protease YdiL (CAAX protease family)
MSVATEEAPQPIDQRRYIIVELLFVTLVTWLPSALNSILDFLYPRLQFPQSVWGEGISVITSLGMLCVPLFLFWANSESWRKLGFTRITWSSVGIAVFMLAVTALRIFTTIPSPDSHSAYALGAAVPHPIYIQLIFIFVRAAREEITQNGYLLARFEELNLSFPTAVFLGATAFAIPHLYQGWVGLISTFIIGSVAASVFLIYRQIWPLIAAHFLWNSYLYIQAYRLYAETRG